MTATADGCRQPARRGFLKAALGGALAGTLPGAAAAQTPDRFVLPDLPYALDALEPAISRETMALHHGRHHAGYVRNLNQLIDGTLLADFSLEEIIVASQRRAEGPALFNNAGQHWNHSEFWRMLKPGGGGVSLPGRLKLQLDADFGSFDGFRAAFLETAKGRFGSGWAWLVMDPSGRLVTVSTANGANPLVTGQIPILGVDVWEHAYYLDYRNRRAAYVEAVLDDLVNWDYVAARFEASGG